MQEEIKDYRGRLACLYDVETGQVETLYKGVRASTVLEIGSEFLIQRGDAVTIVIRISESAFKTIKLKVS